MSCSLFLPSTSLYCPPLAFFFKNCGHVRRGEDSELSLFHLRKDNSVCRCLCSPSLHFCLSPVNLSHLSLPHVTLSEKLIHIRSINACSNQSKATCSRYCHVDSWELDVWFIFASLCLCSKLSIVLCTYRFFFLLAQHLAPDPGVII